MRISKRRVIQVLVSVVVTVLFVAVIAYLLQGRDIPVLQPQGTIAQQQYVLILITVGLGVFVVIPVFILLFSIAWKYRESNTKATYDPELHGHRGFELLWWGVPALIIIALAIITAVSTFALDPYKPLTSDKKPVEVQVIALQWRWLFIYPEHNVATINYMNIPEQTPVNLTITGDAPMNSFWVPALAGQVYAMTGMSTKLHFMADKTGSYNGVSANISGDGYAGMRFKVNSMSQTEFDDWTKQATTSTDWLTQATYDEIAHPTKDTSTKTFGLVQPGLYDGVIMKYMSPMEGHTNTNQHSGEGAH